MNKLQSPCKTCPSGMQDKKTNLCRNCKDRFAYDAILCGVSRDEFESWFAGIADELKFHTFPEHRCVSPSCFRRVKYQGVYCQRCLRFQEKKSKGKQKFEPYKDILRIENVIFEFLDYCTYTYKDFAEAASAFGVNKYYLYTIKNFDTYPSKSMLSAMVDFIKQELDDEDCICES